ncbi:MAG: hypothetical protein AAGN46_06425 [Acidobacteriota bacterium]
MPSMLAKSKASLFVLACLLCLLLTFAVSAGERKADGTEGVAVVPANIVKELRGAGTATYDNNTPFQREGTDGGTVGNRFAIPPEGDPNHSIATVSFAVAGNYSTSVVATVWDVNASNAVVLARQLIAGVSQSPSTTARFSAALVTPVATHTGSFIAGLRNTDYDACGGNTGLGSTCDGVALTMGSSPAPPVSSRGARINFTSGSFVPNITSVTSTGQDLVRQNAIFRVTGDNLPVELMGFSID